MVHLATAPQWPLAEEERLLAGDISIEVLQSADRTLLRERNLELTQRQIGQSVKADTVIIQAINTIEELDRNTNALTKRLREWWKLHWPNADRTRAHEQFLQLADPAQPADALIGGALQDHEREVLRAQLEAVRTLHEQRELLRTFLDEQMHAHARNVAHVAGPMIGAKLIALAGSLQRLAMLPSGTVQLLGAETALFRHLRDRRARPPKHGIIFNHLTLQRAAPRRRGKVARALADAIAIAAKLDHFGGAFEGERLAKKVEDAAARE